MKGKDFINANDFSKSELQKLIELAKKMKASPKKYSSALKGKTLALWFSSPSVRTRTSFEVGMQQLGGYVTSLSGQDTWSIDFGKIGTVMTEKTEHVKDFASVLSRYADAITIRKLANVEGRLGEANALLKTFAEYAEIPVISAECDLYHPCQALADTMTIQEKKKTGKDKKLLVTWSYHPKMTSISVTNSALLMGSQFGMDVVLAHPEGFELPRGLISAVEKNASESGGSFDMVNDWEKGYHNADVVYVKEYGAPRYYGKLAEEKTLRDSHKDWLCDGEKMNLAKRGAIFMHCMPIRRNIVATDSVIDGPRSVIYEQAENRLHTEKALLVKILGE